MQYVDKDFAAQRVELDGNTYFNCTFTDCTLVFSADRPVTIERCTFNECDWVFDGHADVMLKFLTALYHGLGESGEDLVELIFDGVRRRRFVASPLVPERAAS